MNPHNIAPRFARSNSNRIGAIVILLAIALDIACVGSAAAQKLYIAQRAGSGAGLWQANVDGSGLTRILAAVPPNDFDFRDIDLDLEGRTIYMANGTYDNVLVAGLDGSEPRVVLADSVFPLRRYFKT